MHTVSSSDISIQRFPVLAPADGYLLPLSQHPSAALRQLAGPGFCLQLSGHRLVSPCSAAASLQFLPHPCLRLRHRSGLQLRLDFPIDWLNRCSQGINWQLPADAVSAGQQVLDFDPAYLQHKPILSVTVLPHPAIHCEPLLSNRAVQALEPCFFIQLTGKKP